LRRPVRKARPEPDASLARASGVRYRYTLSLSDPSEARGIFQIAAELGTTVRYLLIVHQAEQSYRAYLGLASADLFDLPLRLAARGIQIEHGEQTSNE
jgi:hypothetical protein